jgi:tetratricopeptide (TPR) repeat protein
MGTKDGKYSKGASYPKGEPKRRRPKRGPLAGKRISFAFKSEAKQEDIKESPRKPVSGWRLWLFRVIALTIIPAFLFLLLEITLRIVGYGFPASAIIECKVGGKNVYCNNVKFSWRFFPRNIARVSDPFVFSTDKSDKTYRVFVLGESAAAGIPDGAFCFGRILQVMLRQQYPQANFEVITAAMTAINSHVVLEIAKDCAHHQADLFIVYMGNNEVVGPYGAGTIFAPLSASLSFIRFDMTLKATKVGQLLTNLLESVSPQKDIPKVWQGLEMFLGKQVQADDPRLETVYRHFQRNLEDIKQVAGKSGAKMIFCTVGSNLKDCPPFASLHRSNLTETDKRKWDDIYQQGAAYETDGKYAEAVERYLATAEVDDCYADLQFRLGRCYWVIGEYDKARERYIRACELDTLRFRADSRINEIIRAVASNKTAEGVYLLDAVEVFEKNSPEETPGEELFYEHVHLNFEGNYLLAKAVFEQVEKILPERMERQKESIRPLLTETECAQDLAYTDWDRYKIADDILNAYIKKAPFTNQLYHEEQVGRMEQKLKELKVSLTPEALEKSDAQYRLAIQNDSEDWQLHYKYGKLLTEGLKNYRAAVEQYGLVLEHLDYFVAHGNLGGVFGTLGNLDESVAHNLEAIRINPTCAGAHYNLALAYQQQGRIDKAVEHYSKAIRFEANNVLAYHKLGAILYEQGKIDKAVEIYRRGVLLMPDSAVMHHNLGFLLGEQGHKQEAIKELRAALQIEPNSAEIRRALEVFQEGRGQKR